MLTVYQAPSLDGSIVLMASRADWEAIAGRISPGGFHQPPAARAIRTMLALDPGDFLRITVSRDDAEAILNAAQ